MGSYRFTAREKVLLVLLAVVVALVVWLQFIYLPLQDQLSSLDDQIADAKEQIVVDSAKQERMTTMEQAIADYQEQGLVSRTVPAYNNESEIIALLDSAIGSSTAYSVKFEVQNSTSGSSTSSSSSSSTSVSGSSSGSVLGVSSSHLVRRVMKLSFGCDSYEQARSIVDQVCNGAYPCTVDSFTFSDDDRARQLSSAGVSVSGSGNSTGDSSAYHVTLQATFYEER
jgi:hypothetical protein